MKARAIVTFSYTQIVTVEVDDDMSESEVTQYMAEKFDLRSAHCEVDVYDFNILDEEQADG
tara:strand:+ start:1937 stop:2119 length:183 start_codon:yes stop_codon:yes gene_type:complete